MPLILLGIGSWAVLAAIGVALVAGGNRKPTPAVPITEVDVFLADVLGDRAC